jgi:predicted amidohydrolase
MTAGRARVVAAQHESRAGATEENLRRALALLEQAAGAGAQLAVFPECNLTGYGHETAAECAASALTLDADPLVSVSERCARLGVNAVVGFVERDGSELYNSAALIDDRGEVRSVIRKLHLPCLGVDRFVSQGDREPEVVETSAGRVSMLICADMIFPEAARVAALKGADIVAISACVPKGIGVYADHLIRVRAYENCAYVVYANATGPDGRWSYDGRSQIAGPAGRVLGQAQSEGDELLAAELDLADARAKVRVRQPSGGIPDSYEVDFFGQRRPELYGALTAAIDEQGRPTSALTAQAGDEGV